MMNTNNVNDVTTIEVIRQAMNDWNASSDELRGAALHVAGMRARLAELRMLDAAKRKELAHRRNASAHLRGLPSRHNGQAIDRLLDQLTSIRIEIAVIIDAVEAL